MAHPNPVLDIFRAVQILDTKLGAVAKEVL